MKKTKKRPARRAVELTDSDENILASWDQLSFEQQQIARTRLLSSAGAKELERRERKRFEREQSTKSSPLDSLIQRLEGEARFINEDWVMDGTSFEQDQHTRQASLAMLTAALHLRSLRASLRQDEQMRRARSKRQR